MKTIKMLPYRWKFVGLVLLALSLLLFAVCFRVIAIPSKMGSTTHYFGQGWAQIVFPFLFSLGIVLTALSREKGEDERISEMRHSAIIWSILLFIVIYFINSLSNPLFILLSAPPDSTISPDTYWLVRYYIHFLTSVPALIFYYLVIFNIYLLIDRKRLNNEK